VKETPVVTCFLRNRGDVLLLCRSEKVGSYQGRWGAVAGYLEGEPDASAWREIAEETGLETGVELIRCGESFAVEDPSLGRRWLVHPYLFDCETREVRLDWESTEGEWVPPPEIRRRETVPELWTSYEHVAPSVRSIVADREHGSAYLSLRALEVLRDRASDPDTEWNDVAELARAILEARPSMAALVNRVHRAMHAAGKDVRKLEKEAHDGIARAVEADERAAGNAAALIEGRSVMTISRSGTVSAALTSAEPKNVVVAESRPGLEGRTVAKALRTAGLDVTLVPDAALSAALSSRDVEVVLVGADAILPSGGFVNKVGTRLLALAAREDNVPFYVAAAEDKTSLRESVELEPSDVPGVPLFEKTEAKLVTAVVTENGPAPPARLAQVAERLEALRDWMCGTNLHP